MLRIFRLIGATKGKGGALGERGTVLSGTELNPFRYALCFTGMLALAIEVEE